MGNWSQVIRTGMGWVDYKQLAWWQPLVEAPRIIRAGVGRVELPQNSPGAMGSVSLLGGRMLASKLGTEGIG